jgi:hypothetical protein
LLAPLARGQRRALPRRPYFLDELERDVVLIDVAPVVDGLPVPALGRNALSISGDPRLPASREPLAAPSEISRARGTSRSARRDSSTSCSSGGRRSSGQRDRPASRCGRTVGQREPPATSVRATPPATSPARPASRRRRMLRMSIAIACYRAALEPALARASSSSKPATSGKGGGAQPFLRDPRHVVKTIALDRATSQPWVLRCQCQQCTSYGFPTNSGCRSSACAPRRSFRNKMTVLTTGCLIPEREPGWARLILADKAASDRPAPEHFSAQYVAKS